MSELSKEKFLIIGCDEENFELNQRKNLSYWQKAFRKFFENKGAIVCMVILVLIILMAIIGPSLTKYKFNEEHLKYALENLPPSKEHWFGTDERGRDLFARLWMGARGSLTIGISVSFLNITIGVIYGSICGYFGGLIDDIITRIAEILVSVPSVLVILLMSMILGPGLFSAIIAMSIVGWCNIARIVRGQIYQVKNQEYVLAALALGANNERIITKHLISNIIGITVVAITVEIPNTILNEIILTYIGFISAGSFMTWGNMCRNIGAALLVYPTQVYIPTFFICLTLASFNIIGDALSDALDPKIN